ncbi:uncharacterized protein V6R79_019527 [Siganus canaliculatus]
MISLGALVFTVVATRGVSPESSSTSSDSLIKARTSTRDRPSEDSPAPSPVTTKTPLHGGDGRPAKYSVLI